MSIKKVKGFVKAMSQNDYGFYSACIANSPKEKGQWVGLSNKEPSFNGLEIRKGLTVEVEYDDENYNNATSIKEVQKQGGGNKGGKSGGGKSGGYSRDTSGMEAGHCLNAAYILTKHKKMNVMEEAKTLNTVTATLKESYAKANTDMSDYDVGACVGHAVLNACHLVANKSGKTIDDVPSVAQKILDNISKPILEHIRELKKAPAPEATDNAADSDDGFEEEEESNVPDEPVNDDFEDDIPF